MRVEERTFFLRSLQAGQAHAPQRLIVIDSSKYIYMQIRAGPHQTSRFVECHVSRGPGGVLKYKRSCPNSFIFSKDRPGCHKHIFSCHPPCRPCLVGSSSDSWPWVAKSSLTPPITGGAGRAGVVGGLPRPRLVGPQVADHFSQVYSVLHKYTLVQTSSDCR